MFWDSKTEYKFNFFFSKLLWIFSTFDFWIISIKCFLCILALGILPLLLWKILKVEFSKHSKYPNYKMCCVWYENFFSLQNVLIYHLNWEGDDSKWLVLVKSWKFLPKQLLLLGDPNRWLVIFFFTFQLVVVSLIIKYVEIECANNLLKHDTVPSDP